MTNQAAAAAEEAQLAVEHSKLPLFHSDPKKDQFTGDQWLERFGNSHQAGNWNQQHTKSYFYNTLRDGILQWYHMLSVPKIDINDYEAVQATFIQNLRVQTNNCFVITDFTNMKQRKDETMKQFFTRIGDIAYNYNLKKPNDEIMGALWAAPEEHAEALEAFMALRVAPHRLVHRLDYEQTARNDILYLGLQFFIAGLHTNISLEVIKSNTTDLYEAFLITRLRSSARRRGITWSTSKSMKWMLNMKTRSVL